MARSARSALPTTLAALERRLEQASGGGGRSELDEGHRGGELVGFDLLEAAVLVRFIRRQDLHRRLDMHHDKMNGQRGRLQAVANFMGDLMAAVHGQIAVYFHVEFHKQTQPALAGAAFLNSHHAWH